jgi:hypothetical protein
MNKQQEKIIYDYLTLICKNNEIDNIKINFKKIRKKYVMNTTWDKQVE